MENIRHGDILLVQVEKLPDGLTEVKTDTLMIGSHQNSHKFQNGHFYPKQENQFIFGYFIADANCKLFHPEHGDRRNSAGLMEADITKGNIYQLRKQNEDTHNGMRQVID